MIEAAIFVSLLVGIYFTMQSTLLTAVSIAQKRPASLTVNLILASMGWAFAITLLAAYIKG